MNKVYHTDNMWDTFAFDFPKDQITNNVTYDIRDNIEEPITEIIEIMRETIFYENYYKS